MKTVLTILLTIFFLNVNAQFRIKKITDKPPKVTNFVIPSTAESLTVDITIFTATDDKGVTGYKITETSLKPVYGSSGWLSSPFASYTFSTHGTKTLYAWAKDATGHVSNYMSDVVIITLPDVTQPVITAFTIPATSNSLTIDITEFTATDNILVTGYALTETSSQPVSGWTETAPTSYIFSTDGNKILYAWVKDAAGNVSDSAVANIVITLPDTEPPTVTAFVIPATSESLTVDITTFTATDNVSVTGYKLTESATAPLAGDGGWSGTAPTTYIFSTEGTKTLYAWAKDGAGNVSTSLNDGVVITLEEPPTPEEYPETYTGTIYYVSADGDDVNPGTKAEPFATIDKVNTLTLSGGDAVLFKVQDTFVGTITVGQSGTSGNEITFGAYGNSDYKPVIAGSELVTGTWEVHSGNIYKLTGVDETDIKQLFVDGERAKLARYPDEGYFSITSVTSVTVFGSDDLNPALDYSGAKIIMRTDAYSVRDGSITSNSDTTLTLTAALTNGVSGTTRVIGNGFWLADKLIFLTSAGEWYYDNAANTLYVWMPDSGSPTGHEVRISTIDYGIVADTKNYITIKNIELLHNTTGIQMTASDYVTVNNVTFTNHSLSAINQPDLLCDYMTVQNCSIVGSGSSGIRAMGGNATVINNYFENTGLLANVSKDVQDYGVYHNFGTTIMSRGDNDVIENNTIINCAYNGINFQGLNTSVKYNYISGSNQVLDDGAGIYSYKGDTYANNTRTVGSVIERNIVKDSYGNMAGRPVDYLSGRGIYLDGSSKGVTVKNNVVIGASEAFYIQGGGENLIEGNIFFDGGLGIRYNSGADTITFNRNYLYQTARLGTMINSGSSNNPQRMTYSFTGTYGLYKFDNNVYVTPYTTASQWRYTGTTGSAATTSSFTTWQDSIKGDASATYNGTAMTAGYEERALYNTTSTLQIYYLNNAANVTDAFSGGALTDTVQVQPNYGRVVIGQYLDAILLYSDVIAPVITSFTLSATYDGTVTPATLNATGEATAYKIKDVDVAPLISDNGWSITPSYIPLSTGEKTLYVWARDAAGNISSSDSASTVITGVNDTIIGYNTIYASTSSSTVRRGMPITMTEDGYITSVSVYHDGGAGNYLVGVYADASSAPGTRLAISAETALETGAAWKTASLTTPVFVASGTKVWIAFTTSIGGSKFEAGTPYRAQPTSGSYADGLPDPFGSSTQVTNRVSVYCTYIK